METFANWGNESLPAVLLEAGELGFDHVGADRQRAERVKAFRVGDGRVPLAGLALDRGHRHARQRTTGRVRDDPADCRFRRLRIGDERSYRRTNAHDPECRHREKSHLHERPPD